MTHWPGVLFKGIGRRTFPTNASINQSRRVEACTRTSMIEKTAKAWLYAGEVPEHGLQTVPEPVEGELPEFVQKYLYREGLQVVMFVNRKHPFCEGLHIVPKSKRTKEGLDLFLVAVGGAAAAEEAACEKWPTGHPGWKLAVI